MNKNILFIIIGILFVVISLNEGFAARGHFGYYTSTDPTIPKYREWNGLNISNQLNASDIGAANDAEWVIIKSSPVKFERVMVTLDDNGNVKAQIFNRFRNRWHNLTTISTGIGTTNDASNDLAVEYEQLSGRALAVASNGTANPLYSVWNGTGWSSVQAMPADGCTGTVLRLNMAAKNNSNEIALIKQDSNADYCVQFWNGTAWTNNQTIDATQTVSTFWRHDLAYEQASGDLMVVWEDRTVGAGEMVFRAFNGTAWTAKASIFDSGAGAGNLFVKLAPMRGTNRIMLATEDDEDDLAAIEWNGTNWGTVNVAIDAAIEAIANNPPNFRVFDVSYIGDTGRAILAYSDANFDVPSYFTCDNSSACFAGTWTSGGTTTSATNFCGSAAQDLGWVGLEPDKFSNQLMFYGESQVDFGKCIQSWNGTAWGEWVNNLGTGDLNGGVTQNLYFSFDAFIDNINPNATLLTPSNGSFVNNRLQNLTANFTDNHMLKNYTLYIYNQTGDLINRTSASFPEDANSSVIGILFNFSSDATFKWTYDVFDLAENYFTAILNNTLTIDTVNPLIDFGSSTASNGANLSQSNIFINVTLTEINEANITFRIFNTTALVNSTTLSAGSRSINFTGLANGVYTYNATATDLASNSNTTSTRTITLDTIAPNATLLAPTNNTFANASSQNYTVNATDNISLKNGTLNVYNSTNDIINQTTTSFSGGIVNTIVGVVVNLADGVYKWFYKFFDFSGNSFSTDNRTITLDTTKPLIDYGAGTAVNGANLSQSNVFINATVTEINEANITFRIFNTTALVNSTTLSAGSRSINFTGLANGVYTYNATATDLASNSNTTSTRTITLDTTKPLIQFVSPTDASGSTVIRKNIIVNITASDTNLANITVRLYDSMGLLNQTTSTTSPFFLNFTGLSDDIYLFNATATDFAGNVNITETRNVSVETGPPSVNSIVFTPNSTDDVDPGITIRFNTTVIDSSPISAVILQIFNGTAWNNRTASLLSSNVYNASFTLPSTAQNITFNFYANDSVGNTNISTNRTFESAYDCTWTATPASLGATAGFDQNKFIGNISLNNTGDAQFSASNCTLTFRLTHDLPTGRIYFDDSSLKPSDSIIISAKANRTVRVNATFLTEIIEEPAIITINDVTGTSGISSQTSRNVTATIVSSTGGPYLFQEIDSAPSSASLTNTNFSLEASLRNLLGNGSLSNVAFNVTFNWTLPSGFLVKDGTASLFFVNLTNNSAVKNNITFNSSNLPSLSSGIKTITLTAQGYNSSGDLIVHSQNRTILTSTANVTLSCFGTSDGIAVSACGSLDPDNPVTVETVTTGGGGGGGAGGAAQIVYSKIIEIVRGENQSFDIEAFNRDSERSLENVNLEIQGYPEHLIKINPSVISYLGPRESKNFSVILDIPVYEEYQEVTLTAIIHGEYVSANKVTSVSYSERQNILLIINEASFEEASRSLDNAEKAIIEMKEKGFNTELADELFIEAKKNIQDRIYGKANEVADRIVELSNKAFKADDLIMRIEEAIENPRKTFLLLTGKTILGRITGGESAQRILSLAIAAFDRGDYDTAEERAEEARALLLLERRGNPVVFVIIYWPFILIGSIIAFTLFAFGYAKYQKKTITKRIEILGDDELNAMNLMRDAQHAHFAGRLSEDEYIKKRREYEKRIAKIRKARLTLRSKRVNILNLNQVIQDIHIEKMQVESEIKKLQKDYYVNKAIPKSLYEEQFKELNKRLAEIENEKINAELNTKHSYIKNLSLRFRGEK